MKLCTILSTDAHKIKLYYICAKKDTENIEKFQLLYSSVSARYFKNG